MNRLTSIIPLFFTLFLYFKQTFCLDRSYELCVPKDCGDGRNITYPFYINDLQDPSCGFPGFELNCSNSSAKSNSTINFSGSNYVIESIDYRNRSFRLRNAAIFLTKNESCPSTIRNLTVDPDRFKSVSDTNLILIYNCSDDRGLPVDLERYRIRSCEKNREVFVVLENDRNLRNLTKHCNSGGAQVVKTPVELSGGEERSLVVDGRNYAAVVAKGFVMSWVAPDCVECEGSGGRCGFNRTENRFFCFCPDRPHRVSCKGDRNRTTTVTERKTHTPMIIGVSVGSVFLLALAATVVFTICRVRNRRAFTDFSSKEIEDSSVYFGVPVFSYTELEHATHRFDASQELGDGGFGTVYYGKLRDGREVAVKRLYEHNYKRVQQFMNEVDILTRLRHKNLVSLYGCTSRRSRELLLVYEYISNGTVADHLHGERAKQSPLTWPIRMKIAVETASALVYLHASEIIHRDVKTNNILLDHSFCVKVADFGLSRLLPSDVTHVSTAPQGTPGYVDPEYHQIYQLTEKSDVYSFGVVLIELISSMPAIDISRSREEISLANMAINRIQKSALDELIDPILGSDFETERMMTIVAELAFRCLQFDSETRPTMNEVLEVLRGIQEECTDFDCGIGEADTGNTKPQLPPPSPETEDVGLLKGRITASPISVTAKWHSTSSGSITPNTSA